MGSSACTEKWDRMPSDPKLPVQVSDAHSGSSIWSSSVPFSQQPTHIPLCLRI